MGARTRLSILILLGGNAASCGLPDIQYPSIPLLTVFLEFPSDVVGAPWGSGAESEGVYGVRAWPMLPGTPPDEDMLCASLGAGELPPLVLRENAVVLTATTGVVTLAAVEMFALSLDQPQRYRLAVLNRTHLGAYMGSFLLPPPEATFWREICMDQPREACIFPGGSRPCPALPDSVPEGAECFASPHFPPVPASFDGYIDRACEEAQTGG